jgi:hypothetical protein
MHRNCPLYLISFSLVGTNPRAIVFGESLSPTKNCPNCEINLTNAQNSKDDRFIDQCTRTPQSKVSDDKLQLAQPKPLHPFSTLSPTFSFYRLCVREQHYTQPLHEWQPAMVEECIKEFRLILLKVFYFLFLFFYI